MKCFLRSLALAAFLLINGAAFAVEPGEQLADPVLEGRARAISTGLRCLVCQNETIDESNAGLAHDIRALLRERLVAGDSDQQAVQAIVDRYGEFVLLQPRLHPATLVLWFGPFVLLAAALGGGLVWLRSRRESTEADAPLNPDDRARLDAIMQEHES